MPFFHAHIPAPTFTSEGKHGLADALNLGLHKALDTSMEDRFIVVSEDKDDVILISTETEVPTDELAALIDFGYYEGFAALAAAHREPGLTRSG